MSKKHSDFDVEQLSLSELSALEAGVVYVVSDAPHEEAFIETEERSREVKREIGVH